MGILAFLLLISICIGLVYIVHKHFGKEQFYLLGIIYSVLSYIMSFKITNILGVDINTNIIFSSGLLIILYYFVKKYSEKESRKFIITTILSCILCICFLIITVLMTPSIYDKMGGFYQNITLDNIAIVVLYPISLSITMFLGEYCFKELVKEDKNENIKTVFTLLGILFIDAAIFSYFSYAFIIQFNTAIGMAIENYLVKTGIMVIYMLIVNKLFMVKKVK